MERQRQARLPWQALWGMECAHRENTRLWEHAALALSDDGAIGTESLEDGWEVLS